MVTPENTEDAFGFRTVSNSVRDRIRQIKPAAPPGPPPDMAAIDAAAQNVGFVSREVPQLADLAYRSKKSQRSEPTIALNMRAPISLGNTFRRFCEENRYSYPEGLAEIMLRAGLPTK